MPGSSVCLWMLPWMRRREAEAGLTMYQTPRMMVPVRTWQHRQQLVEYQRSHGDTTVLSVNMWTRSRALGRKLRSASVASDRRMTSRSRCLLFTCCRSSVCARSTAMHRKSGYFQSKTSNVTFRWVTGIAKMLLRYLKHVFLPSYRSIYFHHTKEIVKFE